MLMSKDSTITVRIEGDLKNKAEKVLKKLGLSPSNAVSMLYKQITLRNGLPFDVKIPNNTTQTAIKESRTKKKSAGFSSVSELMKDLNS